MKKFMLILSLLFAVNVQAGLITIDVSDTDVMVGDSITVNLNATGFDPFDTFDLDFVFDNSLFAFEAASFSSDLMLDLPFIFEANENLNGLAISFLNFVPYINADFLLASFQLTALTEGTADFSINNAMFSDFFTPITVESSPTASTNISTQVPEPNTWIILLTALIMIGRINRSA